MKLNDEQIYAITAALDGQPFSVYQEVLPRLARAFNFDPDEFQWCVMCAGVRRRSHWHNGSYHGK